MAKTYNKKIDRNTAWGGDMSTSGLPVSGKRVQEFIKDELNIKPGAFLKPSGGNFVYCFATKEDRDLFLATDDESLIIDRFETESNYVIETDYVPMKSVIEGTTGNTVEFSFKITDKAGRVSDSRASITFTFRSSGVLKKYTTEVRVKSEGWTNVTSDVIDEYLRSGENEITIMITGLSTKTSSQFVITYNVFNLEFSSDFQYNVPQTGNTIQVPYHVKCSEPKYIEFYIDGVEVNSIESQAILDNEAFRTANIDITNLPIGQHTFQTRAYVTEKYGTRFYSDSYYYSFAKIGDTTPSFLMFVKFDNTKPITLSGENLLINAKQYEQFSFDWSIYDHKSRRLKVCFEYDGSLVSKTSVTNGLINEFSFRPFNYGDGKILRVYSIDEEHNTTIFENTILLNISGDDSGLKETVDNLLLKLTAQGRRNTDENKDVWECVGNDLSTYRATFNNFAWNSQQGWNEEDEALVISDDAYVDFNIQPMINHWEENGGTFEIDLETFDIEDENAVICECKNNVEGISTAYFRITATNAEFSTADGKKINTRYKDNERLKIAFIGNKKGTHEDGNLIYIMVNGVLERAAMYSDSDSIFSTEYLRVGTGNGGCKVKLRSIRVYNRAITVDEEFNNYVVDSEDSQIIYEKNNIFKTGTSEVGFDEVANKLPVMIFTGDMNDLVSNGQDKKWRYFDVEYVNRQEPERNFVSFNCQMKLQGTSSLGYPRKNFKLKTKDKNATISEYQLSDFELDTEETEVGNRRLRNKTTGQLADFGDLKERCFTFGYLTNGSTNILNAQMQLLEKGKYRFRSNCHKANKWTLKADYMESSCSHNVGAGRSWNDIFENTKLQISDYAGYKNHTYKNSALVYNGEYKEYVRDDGANCRINFGTQKMHSYDDYVCRTDAQKICLAEGADDIRTAVDGFPMVCFYRTSHEENKLIFMGQYNFINDKASYEVFGFEDIEDPNDESENPTLIYDASKVECWEGLKNTNPISLFKTIEDWGSADHGWSSTFESRYPELKDDDGGSGDRQPDASTSSPLYELCKWVTSTRHESDTVYGDEINVNAWFAKRINTYQYGYNDDNYSGYTYLPGNVESITLPDTAENRQKKFEVEKWEHFDVWKLAGYYIYLMRYGAVDQFVKNTMLFTDGNGKFDPREDKKYRKWFYINYDNDCLFGLRNNGELAFHWRLDRQTLDNSNDIIIDENNSKEYIVYDEDNNIVGRYKTEIEAIANVPEGGRYEVSEGEEDEYVNTYAMMGHDSTLWNNLERDEEFMRMVRDLDDSMNMAGLNYNNMVTEFDTKQTEMWCERIYNANERYKYIQAAKGIGDMEGNPKDNLWMLQGTRRSHRHWWIANHFNMLDARWLSGDYKNTYMQIKTNAPLGATIMAKAGDDYYFAWGQQKRIYESDIRKQKGEDIEFVFPIIQAQGDPVYIYAYNKMSELDFSNIAYYVSNDSFQFFKGNLDVANTLKKLVIGNSAVTNNIELTTTTWDKLENLEYLDITNYIGIKDVPYEGLPNLHTIKAFGSGLSRFAPVEGSRFDLVELPPTISSIILNNVNIENLVENFKYTPTTNLRGLEIYDNANGIDNTYYDAIVYPWLNAINMSSESNYIYSLSHLTLENVNWSFDWQGSVDNSMNKLRIFKNISSKSNFTITGKINISNFGSLSIGNIEEIKEIFGENCFNEKTSAIYIKTPQSIFIHESASGMVAGQTSEFTREIYPDETSLSGSLYSIYYRVVEKTNEDPTLNPSVIVDILDNEKYLPVGEIIDRNTQDLSSIREGLMLTTEMRDGKEVGVLSSSEIIENKNDNIKVMCVLEQGYSKKVSVCDFTILDPTYATGATINGPKSLYKRGIEENVNGEYKFTMSLMDRFGNKPIGTEDVTWSISMGDMDTYLYEPLVSSDTLEMTLITKENQPLTSEEITIVGTVYNGNGTVINNIRYNVLFLNENVIMTIETNPIVMRICADQGWCDENDHNVLTKENAWSVTDIDSAFAGAGSNNNKYTFNEFKHFTGVTEINDAAFQGSRGLTEITLPNTVNRIGANAFDGCSNLEKISTGNENEVVENTLPRIQIINEMTFKNCSKLNKLVIPDSVTEIKEFAFGGTTFKNVMFSTDELLDNTILLPNSVTKIDGDAFELSNWGIWIDRSSPIEVLSLPVNINLQGEYHLLYGPNIKEFRTTSETAGVNSVNGVLYTKNGDTLMKYPAKKEYVETFYLNDVDGIQVVDSYAFLFVENLDNIVFPGSVNSIGTHAFERSKIKTITISGANTLQSIPEYCFSKCHDLTDVVLPGSTKTIGSYAFYDCPSLTGFSLTSQIEYLGVHGDNLGDNFYNCGFSELVMPDSITGIGKNAIVSCPNLTYVEFPKLCIINGIDTCVSNCPSLETVMLPVFSYYGENNENITVNGVMPYNFINSCESLNEYIANTEDNGNVCYVYDCSVYSTVDNRLVRVPIGISNVAIKDGTKIIGGNAFDGCKFITEINIPDTVTSFGGNECFRGCTSLISIRINDSFSNLPRRCFQNCTNLSRLVVGSGVTRIGYSCFAGCSNLSEIYFYSFSAPALEWANPYAVNHPFGGDIGGGYAGVVSKLSGSNIIYVPYNSTRYDRTDTDYSDGPWSGNPVTNSDMCAYSYQFIPVEYNSFIVKIYDENNEIVNGIVYAVNQRGGLISNSYIERYNGHVFVCTADEVYHGENISIYTDAELNNKIGEFMIDANKTSYEVSRVLGAGTRGIVFGSSNNEEDTVTISRQEYDSIIGNLEILNKLMFGK